MKEVLFPVLEQERRKRNVTWKQISAALQIDYKSLYNKLRGITAFTWDEVCLIRERFFPDLAVDKLFYKAK